MMILIIINTLTLVRYSVILNVFWFFFLPFVFRMSRWTQTRAARFLAPSSQRLPSTNFLLKRKIRNLKDIRWVSAQQRISDDMLSFMWLIEIQNNKSCEKQEQEEEQKVHFEYRQYLLSCFLLPLTLLWCYSFPLHMSILLSFASLVEFLCSFRLKTFGGSTTTYLLSWSYWRRWQSTSSWYL